MPDKAALCPSQQKCDLRGENVCAVAHDELCMCRIGLVFPASVLSVPIQLTNVPCHLSTISPCSSLLGATCIPNGLCSRQAASLECMDNKHQCSNLHVKISWMQTMMLCIPQVDLPPDYWNIFHNAWLVVCRVAFSLSQRATSRRCSLQMLCDTRACFSKWTTIGMAMSRQAFYGLLCLL